MSNAIVTTPFFDTHVAIGRALNGGVRPTDFWLSVRNVEGGENDEAIRALVDDVNAWLEILDADAIDDQNPAQSTFGQQGVTLTVRAVARSPEFRQRGAPFVVNPVPAMAWYT